MKLIVFNSSNTAMKAEVEADRAGINSRLIPLPPKIDSSCGLCLKVEDLCGVLRLFKEKNIEFRGVYDEEYKKIDISGQFLDDDDKA